MFSDIIRSIILRRRYPRPTKEQLDRIYLTVVSGDPNKEVVSEDPHKKQGT